MANEAQSRSSDERKQAARRGSPRTRRDAPSIQRQAARHSRIREDHAAEIAEDYVELIAALIEEQGEARAVELSQRLGVSHVTVTKTIARLQRDGLVHTEPYRSIFLTEAGRALARAAAERHTLVVAFLLKLGVNETDAQTDAEGIEHHLSPATLDAMRRFVDEAS